MEAYNVFLPNTPFIIILYLYLICDFGRRYGQFFVCGLCGSSACGLCGNFACGLRASLARYSLRFAPAGVASRAPGRAVTLPHALKMQGYTSNAGVLFINGLCRGPGSQLAGWRN